MRGRKPVDEVVEPIVKSTVWFAYSIHAKLDGIWHVQWEGRKHRADDDVAVGNEGTRAYDMLDRLTSMSLDLGSAAPSFKLIKVTETLTVKTEYVPPLFAEDGA